MTSDNEIIDGDDLQPQLEGEQVKKEDLENKPILVNLQNFVPMDEDGKPFAIIQFQMDGNKKKKLYTTAAGGVPHRKFVQGQENGYKFAYGKFVKKKRENKKKGEQDWYWDFVSA